MKASLNFFKKSLCLILCLAMVFSFTGCSSKKLTEENVIKTVEKAEKALIKSDLAAMKKYIKLENSQNSKIKIDIKNIGGKKKLLELSKSIFENLEIEVVSVDLEAKTVDVDIKNKVFYLATSEFISSLQAKNSYSQLLQKLTDDDFINTNVDEYLQKIENLPINTVPKRVTLKIEQTKRGLVLVLDKEAEDAITGEATIAIRRQFIGAQ